MAPTPGLPWGFPGVTGLPLGFLTRLNSSCKAAAFLKCYFWVNKHLVTIQGLFGAGGVTLLMHSPCLLFPMGQTPPQESLEPFPSLPQELNQLHVLHSKSCLSPQALSDFFTCVRGRKKGGEVNGGRAAEVRCKEGNREEGY